MGFLYRGKASITITFLRRSYRREGQFRVEASDTGDLKISCTFEWNAAWSYFYHRVHKLRHRDPLGFVCTISGSTKSGDKFQQSRMLISSIQEISKVGKRTRINLTAQGPKQNLRISNGRSARPFRVRYYLATPLFSGQEWIESTAGQQRGRIKLVTQWGTMLLDRVPNYQRVEEQAKANGQSATTGILEIRGSLAHDERDQLAFDICDLLSVALRSEVQWVYAEGFTSANRSLFRDHRQTKVRPPIAGNILIDNHGELGRYLESCLSNLVALRRENQFHIALQYYLESQYTSYLQMKYILTWLCLEYLRRSLESHFPSYPKPVVTSDLETFNRFVAILLEQYFPMSAATNKEYFRNRLNDLNEPPNSDCILHFLKLQGIEGFERRHAQLRNALVHHGGLGAFSFQEALQLYLSLNRIVVEVILRCIGYRGWYLDASNGWISKYVP